MSKVKRKMLAIIPARGGSERLPDKNLRMLCGKPLIHWTLEAARKSRHIATAMVTTDDKMIRAYAAHHGVETPFLRPRHLSTNTASSLDVILHVLSCYEAKGMKFDDFILLQPTSPLRCSHHIDEAVELFYKKRAKSVLSVSPSSHKVHWSYFLPASHSLGVFLDKIKCEKKKRFYTLNGAIYIANWDFFKMHKRWNSERTYAYVMDETNSIDIDTEEDLVIARMRSKGILK